MLTTDNEDVYTLKINVNNSTNVKFDNECSGCPKLEKPALF